MMIWSKVEEIIPFLFDNQLDVIYNTEKIFTHAQVLNVLDYTYESFSFRHKDTQSPMSGFTAQFWGYSNEVAPQYARMLDAIDREYNPISNYEMVESGYDGTKVSDKINTSISDSLNANALASVSNVEDPYSRSTNNTQNGKVKTTQAGSETADNYVNAFDTGISDTGTLAEKNVNTFNNRASTVEYGAEGSAYTNIITESTSAQIKKHTDFSTLTGEDFTVKDYDTNTDKTISGEQFNTAVKGISSGKNNESNTNDVTLTMDKLNPDGTTTKETVGVDFTNGTMHKFTRSGNIGVTTNQQMLEAEIALRQKTNLLQDFIKGFIIKYCCYLGEEE